MVAIVLTKESSKNVSTAGAIQGPKTSGQALSEKLNGPKNVSTWDKKSQENAKKVQLYEQWKKSKSSSNSSSSRSSSGGSSSSSSNKSTITPPTEFFEDTLGNNNVSKASDQQVVKLIRDGNTVGYENITGKYSQQGSLVNTFGDAKKRTIATISETSTPTTVKASNKIISSQKSNFNALLKEKQEIESAIKKLESGEWSGISTNKELNKTLGLSKNTTGISRENAIYTLRNYLNDNWSRNFNQVSSFLKNPVVTATMTSRQLSAPKVDAATMSKLQKIHPELFAKSQEISQNLSYFGDKSKNISIDPNIQQRTMVKGELPSWSFDTGFFGPTKGFDKLRNEFVKKEKERYSKMTDFQKELYASMDKSLNQPTAFDSFIAMPMTLESRNFATPEQQRAAESVKNTFFANLPAGTPQSTLRRKSNATMGGVSRKLFSAGQKIQEASGGIGSGPINFAAKVGGAFVADPFYAASMALNVLPYMEARITQGPQGPVAIFEKQAMPLVEKSIKEDPAGFAAQILGGVMSGVAMEKIIKGKSKLTGKRAAKLSKETGKTFAVIEANSGLVLAVKSENILEFAKRTKGSGKFFVKDIFGSTSYPLEMKSILSAETKAWDTPSELSKLSKSTDITQTGQIGGIGVEPISYSQRQLNVPQGELALSGSSGQADALATFTLLSKEGKPVKIQRKFSDLDFSMTDKFLREQKLASNRLQLSMQERISNALFGDKRGFQGFSGSFEKSYGIGGEDYFVGGTKRGTVTAPKEGAKPTGFILEREMAVATPQISPNQFVNMMDELGIKKATTEKHLGKINNLVSKGKDPSVYLATEYLIEKAKNTPSITKSSINKISNDLRSIQFKQTWTQKDLSIFQDSINKISKSTQFIPPELQQAGINLRASEIQKAIEKQGEKIAKQAKGLTLTVSQLDLTSANKNTIVNPFLATETKKQQQAQRQFENSIKLQIQKQEQQRLQEQKRIEQQANAQRKKQEQLRMQMKQQAQEQQKAMEQNINNFLGIDRTNVQLQKQEQTPVPFLALDITPKQSPPPVFPWAFPPLQTPFGIKRYLGGGTPPKKRKRRRKYRERFPTELEFARRLLSRGLGT